MPQNRKSGRHARSGAARLALAVVTLILSFPAASADASPRTGPSRSSAEPSRVSVGSSGFSAVGPAGTGSAAAGQPTGTGFRWPLDGTPRPVRRFEPPPYPWSPGHRGVDLAAVPGAVVRAAGAGVVSFVGMVAGRPVVSVAHADGLRTTYEPVAGTVRVGERVRAGDPIGVLRAGHPGCAGAACLHWGLRRGDEYLDPLSLLGLGRVRLFPLSSPSQ